LSELFENNQGGPIFFEPWGISVIHSTILSDWSIHHTQWLQTATTDRMRKRETERDRRDGVCSHNSAEELLTASIQV